MAEVIVLTPAGQTTRVDTREAPSNIGAYVNPQTRQISPNAPSPHAGQYLSPEGYVYYFETSQAKQFTFGDKVFEIQGTSPQIEEERKRLANAYNEQMRREEAARQTGVSVQTLYPLSPAEGQWQQLRDEGYRKQVETRGAEMQRAETTRQALQVQQMESQRAYDLSLPGLQKAHEELKQKFLTPQEYLFKTREGQVVTVRQSPEWIAQKIESGEYVSQLEKGIPYEKTEVLPFAATGRGKYADVVSKISQAGYETVKITKGEKEIEVPVGSYIASRMTAAEMEKFVSEPQSIGAIDELVRMTFIKEGVKSQLAYISQPAFIQPYTEAAYAYYSPFYSPMTTAKEIVKQKTPSEFVGDVFGTSIAGYSRAIEQTFGGTRIPLPTIYGDIGLGFTIPKYSPEEEQRLQEYRKAIEPLPKKISQEIIGGFGTAGEITAGTLMTASAGYARAYQMATKTYTPESEQLIQQRLKQTTTYGRPIGEFAPVMLLSGTPLAIYSGLSIMASETPEEAVSAGIAAVPVGFALGFLGKGGQALEWGTRGLFGSTVGTGVKLVQQAAQSYGLKAYFGAMALESELPLVLQYGETAAGKKKYETTKEGEIKDITPTMEQLQSEQFRVLGQFGGSYFGAGAGQFFGQQAAMAATPFLTRTAAEYLVTGKSEAQKLYEKARGIKPTPEYLEAVERQRQQAGIQATAIYGTVPLKTATGTMPEKSELDFSKLESTSKDKKGQKAMAEIYDIIKSEIEGFGSFVAHQQTRKGTVEFISGDYDNTTNQQSRIVKQVTEYAKRNNLYNEKGIQIIADAEGNVDITWAGKKGYSLHPPDLLAAQIPLYGVTGEMPRTVMIKSESGGKIMRAKTWLESIYYAGWAEPRGKAETDITKKIPQTLYGLDAAYKAELVGQKTPFSFPGEKPIVPYSPAFVEAQMLADIKTIYPKGYPTFGEINLPKLPVASIEGFGKVAKNPFGFVDIIEKAPATKITKQTLENIFKVGTYEQPSYKVSPMDIKPLKTPKTYDYTTGTMQPAPMKQKTYEKLFYGYTAPTKPTTVKYEEKLSSYVSPKIEKYVSETYEKKAAYPATTKYEAPYQKETPYQYEKPYEKPYTYEKPYEKPYQYDQKKYGYEKYKPEYYKAQKYPYEKYGYEYEKYPYEKYPYEKPYTYQKYPYEKYGYEKYPYKKTPPPTPPPGKELKSFEEKKKKGFEAFGVFVRKKGKLVKVSQQPLTERAAYALGQQVTDVTAARSFFVKPENTFKPGKELSLRSFSPERYYVGQRGATKGALIEKTSFAISTGGEKREISYKGVQANREKKLFSIFGGKKR